MTSTRRLALLGGSPAVHRTPAYSWPPITREDAEVIADMALRGEISYYGREGYIAELESKLASYLNLPYALATSSGTTALHSAYFGLGLEPGDEVICPTYTFLATVMPLFVVNAVPVLVDLDPQTGNLDPGEIERNITSRTRAVVVTHLWGQPADMGSILAIARRHGLKVVEDCSHAHGATIGSQQVGTFGEVGVFSLQGKKLVSAGQGGILATRDLEIFERAVLLGHFNVRSYEDVHSPAYRPFAYAGFGLNYRMHPFAAALASRQLDRLETYLAQRRANLELLTQKLSEVPGVIPPDPPAGTEHAYYTYKLRYRADEIDDLPIDLYVRALQAEGVPVERYTMPPLHHLPIFQRADLPLRSYGSAAALGGQEYRTYSNADLPRSNTYAEALLSLPAYTDPVPQAITEIAAAFEKVWSERGRLRDVAHR